MKGTNLSIRARSETLAASDGTVSFQRLLSATACAAAWRVVEVFSTVGPVEVELSWSGGDASGQSARLTVPRAARVSVFASSLTVRVANLTDAPNGVTCGVSDGYCVASCFQELRDTGVADTPLELDIPPFATAVSVGCADKAQLSNITVTLTDGLGDVRVELSADELPVGGLPLGGAKTVSVLAPAALRFRVVFHLSL